MLPHILFKTKKKKSEKRLKIVCITEGMSCKVWIVSVLVFSLIYEKCKLQYLKMNFCGENGW